MDKKQLRQDITDIIEAAFEKLEVKRIARGGKLYPSVGGGKSFNQNYPVYLEVPGNDSRYYLYKRSNSNIARIYDAIEGQFVKFLPTENLYLYNEGMKECLGCGFLHRWVDYSIKDFNKIKHLTVDHKNNIKCDNRLSELERCSRKENVSRSAPVYALSNGVIGKKSVIMNFLESMGYTKLEYTFKQLVEGKFVQGLYCVSITNTKEERNSKEIYLGYFNPCLWSLIPKK